MKKQITITLDERQADKLRQLAKNSTIRGSVSEYISQLVDNKTTGSWVLQYIAGGGGLSDYAVAYCPCCRTYLSAYTYPNFDLMICIELKFIVLMCLHLICIFVN